MLPPLTKARRCIPQIAFPVPAGLSSAFPVHHLWPWLGFSHSHSHPWASNIHREGKELEEGQEHLEWGAGDGIFQRQSCQGGGVHGRGAHLGMMRPGHGEVEESEPNRPETQENREERSVALPWKRECVTWLPAQNAAPAID